MKNKSIKTIDCQQHISDFLSTGSFLEGTVFKRNRERKTSKGYYMYWDYSCPVCSNDEYVQAGLCSGVFTNTSGNLKSGKKSCRCIDSYRWTQEQREHQINKICKQEGIIFIGWADGGYENAFSKILWNCGKNNHQSTTDDFINAGRRCGCYRETLHGFNPTKPASIYITRWYGYCESYLKFGITNRDVKVRVSEQDSASKHLDYEILYEGYSDDGGLIQDIERKCKQSLNTGACSEKLLPDGYTETVYDTEDNLNSLLQIINSCLNTQ